MTGIFAIVPLKDTRLSKQRLAGLLTPHERQTLAQVMFEDVMAALVPAIGAERCLVVTVDAHGLEVAGRHGVRTTDQGAHDGHTGAVMGGVGLLQQEGAAGFLTLPGDIPRMASKEVQALLDAHRGSRGFTIAPAYDRQGSNAIVCSPPDAVPLRFGSNSFYPHLHAARRAGIEPLVLELPGIAADIDTPDDLAHFMGLVPRLNTSTERLLESWNIRERLAG